jgi:hypothetical protein
MEGWEGDKQVRQGVGWVRGCTKGTRVGGGLQGRTKDELCAGCFSPLAAGGGGMDSTEYAVTCLHLLVNVGLACRDLFVSLRRIGTSAAMSQRVLALVDQLRAGEWREAGGGGREQVYLCFAVVVVPRSQQVTSNHNRMCSCAEGGCGREEVGDAIVIEGISVAVPKSEGQDDTLVCETIEAGKAMLQLAVCALAPGSAPPLPPTAVLHAAPSCAHAPLLPRPPPSDSSPHFSTPPPPSHVCCA